ncbi:MAG: NAD(P)-dependent oxidoreductase [Alistipes onderdonkii]
MSMPKGATLVNTARKEVIDEQGVVRALTEREDLKYITDIAAGNQAELDENSASGCLPPPKMGPRPPRPISTRVWPQPPNRRFFRNGNTRFR